MKRNASDKAAIASAKCWDPYALLEPGGDSILSHNGNGDATVMHSERYTTCKASLVSAEMASESRSAMALQTSCDLQSATHTV